MLVDVNGVRSPGVVSRFAGFPVYVPGATTLVAGFYDDPNPITVGKASDGNYYILSYPSVTTVDAINPNDGTPIQYSVVERGLSPDLLPPGVYAAALAAQAADPGNPDTLPPVGFPGGQELGNDTSWVGRAVGVWHWENTVDSPYPGDAIYAWVAYYTDQAYVNAVNAWLQTQRGSTFTEFVRPAAILVGGTIAAAAAVGFLAPELGAATSTAADATTAASTAAAGATSDAAVASITAGVDDTVAGAAAAAGDVAGSVSAEAGGVAAAAGGTAAAVDTGATAATDSAVEASATTVADTVGSIVDDVKGFIDDAKGFLSDIFGPIGDVVSGISDIVKDVNENLIKPITGPITSIMQNYNALQGALTRDLHDGVAGLLRVPQDIGNALSSIDATMQRTVAVLGAQNQATIHAELGPGVGQGVIMGADATRASINQGMDQYISSERSSIVARLGSDPGVDDIAAMEAKIARLVDQEFPIVGKVGGFLLDIVTSLTMILSYIEAKHEEYKHIGALKWPTAILDPGTVIQAYMRGILPNDQVATELGKSGFDDTRQQVLKELSRTLPTLQQALDWEARGIIDQTARVELSVMAGFTAEDGARAAAADKALPSPGDAITWYFRGALGLDELTDILKAYKYRDADLERIVAMGYRQPGVGDILQRFDRQGLIGANVAPQSLTESAPDDVAAQLGQLGIPPNVAALLWVNHYQMLQPADAVQAWFRGYISADMLNAILQSSGLVREQWQNYIDLQRPLFTVRNVPTLLPAGIISQSEAMAILLANGYDEVDADRMVRYALQKAKPTSGGTADTLHGLTVSAITKLYDAGAQTRDEATALLIHAGLGTEAAQLTLTLRDVENQASERAAAAAVIVDEAKAGLLTFTEAQAQLGQAGLTTNETAKALDALTKSLTARTKLPSEAQTVDMYKRGILTRTAAAQTLGLIGYSDAWSELLIQLAEGGSNASATSSSS